MWTFPQPPQGRPSFVVEEEIVKVALVGQRVMAGLVVGADPDPKITAASRDAVILDMMTNIHENGLNNLRMVTSI